MEARLSIFREQNLLSPGDAVATFLRAVDVAPPGVESVELGDAFGRILAQPVDADADYPDAPRSAMDGFAVAAAATPGALRVAGEIAMGNPWPSRLERGSALRIPTGGVVPEGADAVVPIEDAHVDGSIVTIAAAVGPGENVNPRASDMRAGEAALASGTWIGAPQLGVLATLGIVNVPVYRQPVVAVLSSGDELVAPDRRPAPGQIRDSNRFAVAGALRAMGARPLSGPVVPDRPGALAAAFAAMLDRCDAAVVTGGSSVGEADRTPEAIAALGEPGVIVHGLRVKPGKPTVLGAAGRKPLIGLPGNPTSALVILEAVLAPVLGKLCGAPPRFRVVEARLAQPVRGRKGWTWYLPVALRHEGGSWVAHPLNLRSSSVSLTARADGFIVVAEAVETIDAGASVSVTHFL